MSNLYKSAEDYLETILVLRQRIGNVRSIDVVNELGFSKPSVSVAMKKLRESGHITMDNDGYIVLSDIGEQVAQSVYDRHNVLVELLKTLGVNEQTALDDACKIEHCLSEETFDKIREHMKKIKN